MTRNTAMTALKPKKDDDSKTGVFSKIGNALAVVLRLDRVNSNAQKYLSKHGASEPAEARAPAVIDQDGVDPGTNDPEIAEQMAAMEVVMRDKRNLLKRLADT
ncbi:MAG: hypothetical protein V6Z81_09340 [Parvularculales bacterium]